MLAEQKFRSFVTVVFALCAALFSSVGRTQAAPVLDQSFLNEPPKGGFSMGLGNEANDQAVLVQTFTVGIAGLFDSVRLAISRPGALGTPNLTISIGAVSGGVPTGVMLGTVIVAPGAIPTAIPSYPTADDLLAVDLTALNIQLTVGEQLAIIASNVVDTPNQLVWSGPFFPGGGYSGGNGLYFAASTAGPYGCCAFDDAIFQTYVDTGAPVPEPTSLELAATVFVILSLVGLGRRPFLAPHLLY